MVDQSLGRGGQCAFISLVLRNLSSYIKSFISDQVLSMSLLIACLLIAALLSLVLLSSPSFPPEMLRPLVFVALPIADWWNVLGARGIHRQLEETHENEKYRINESTLDPSCSMRGITTYLLQSAQLNCRG